MLKNSIRFLTLVLMTTFPLAAYGWTLNTWAKSAGGYLSSPNFSGNQTSVNGSVNKTYTTASPITVTIVPNAGYSISALTRNGIIQSLANPATTQVVEVAGPSNQSVTATFARTPLTLSATAGSNGVVSTASIAPVYVGPQSPAKVFTFTPAAGYSVQTISVPEHDLNADYFLTNAANGTVATLPAPPNVTVKVNIVDVKKSILVTGLFAVVGANAGPAQTVQPGSTAVLDGRASTGATSFTWAQLSGPATVSLSGAATSTPSFTVPATPGYYQFKLTINNGSSSATTSVYVTSDPTAAATSQCQNCHATVGVGTATHVFSDWVASPHNNSAAPVMCYGCHTGANTGAHPGPALSSLANVCRNCHLDAQGNVAGHPFPTGTNTCVSCHNPHSTTATSFVSTTGAPHYNNITTAGYPASYVTSRSSCANCHSVTDANAAIRHEWAQSGHGNITSPPWTEYDFKTRAGCVQCHTTTGFIAYSSAKVTAAWGAASDKTKEVLTCIGCHTNLSNGTVRTVVPAKPFADEAGYTNRNVGASNICMDCHSGRNNGASIQVKVGSADFSNLAYIAPHYLSAGGTLHGKSGYHFPGRTYADYSSNSHRRIGMANTAATGTDGPCVTCHMTATSKHLFSPVSTDQNGAITAITTSVCTNCHAASMPAATLETDRVAFNNALDVLKAQLQAKGFTYTPGYPYFSTKNWGTGQAGANVMGAAFNYKLIAAEPGAYVHNAAYAKQLIVDSIDAVYHDGTVTGDISDALAALVASNAISQEAADSLGSYRAGSSCTSCHTNSSGSHTAHLTRGMTCAACHSATAASSFSLVPGTDKHQNGLREVAFPSAGVYAAGTCSGIYCHSNGRGTFQNAAWGSGSMTCASCHPNLGGAHAAHIGDPLGSVTFYAYTSNNSSGAVYRFGCANCHPVDSASHMDGHVDVTLKPELNAGTLKNRNTTVAAGGIGNTGSGITGTSGSSVVCSAAYCHSNGWTGGTLVYANSPDWYNAAAYTGEKCAMCHGNSPNSTKAGSPAHAKHAVSIHAGKLYDGAGNLLPNAGPAGTNAGHGDAAQATVINCDTCHSGTVTNSANDNSSACVSCHTGAGQGTPALNTARHLNGTVDVAFKGTSFRTKAQLRQTSYDAAIWTRTTYKAGVGSYDQASFAAASWNAGTCANVACHNNNSVAWSAGTLSCTACHSQL